MQDWSQEKTPQNCRPNYKKFVILRNVLYKCYTRMHAEAMLCNSGLLYLKSESFFNRI